MFFNQNQPGLLGGMGGGGGLGSLASLMAMGAGSGASAAPVLPKPGQVPQSGPGASPMPAMPQPPQQSNILQALMQNPQMLQQLLQRLGMGSFNFGNSTNMINGSPGLVSNLLASPDFSSFRGEGGAY